MLHRGAAHGVHVLVRNVLGRLANMHVWLSRVYMDGIGKDLNRNTLGMLV